MALFTFSNAMIRNRMALLFFFNLVVLPSYVNAILQTGAVDVSLRSGESYTLLASQASFGAYPEEGASKNEGRRLILPPSDNSLLCQNVTSNKPRSLFTGKTVLVPRGQCTFEFKAFQAQQLGAAAILIYGTLGSRYSLNSTKYINQTDFNYTKDDIVYPQQYYDYDCKKGKADIPLDSIQFTPLPYNSEHNDPLLSRDSNSNLCRKNSKDSLSDCDSKACLLTGNKDGDTMEACCAWDLHVWLYDDPSFDPSLVTIPAAYLTMHQGQRLLDDMQRDQQIYVNLYSRYRPSYNFSAILIWMLGVFVAAIAAYFSADDYHRMIRKALRKRDRRGDRRSTGDGGAGSRSVGARSESPRTKRVTQNDIVDSTMIVQRSSHNEEEDHGSQRPAQFDDSLELNMWHAVGFVIVASSGLLILFFFKVSILEFSFVILNRKSDRNIGICSVQIYNAVKVFYAIGCSKAVSQVIFFPICWRIARKLNYRDQIVWRTGTEDFGDITVLDIISHVAGYGLGLSWLIVCFTVRHPEDNTFFWITQDILGACMCIQFLEVIKLNSLKVAALLLIVAFFYDIFFVFVTPYLFKGKSIMITVATSGGPPTADPAWCEKYPDDKNCQGGEPLPMLFQIPRLGDYMGGSSLLGLGDIVLPGLLLSFAARLDAAKSLLGLIGGGNGALNSYGCPEQKYCGGCRICSGGYFPPLVIAYAVGLFSANLAVYLMKMGQPALLYLVPCTVGTMGFMAWRRNELDSLWEGPKAIRTADVMLYGEQPVESNIHEPVPVEEGQDIQPVPSAIDTDGEMPLVSAVQDDRNIV